MMWVISHQKRTRGVPPCSGDREVDGLCVRHSAFPQNLEGTLQGACDILPVGLKFLFLSDLPNLTRLPTKRRLLKLPLEELKIFHCRWLNLTDWEGMPRLRDLNLHRVGDVHLEGLPPQLERLSVNGVFRMPHHFPTTLQMLKLKEIPFDTLPNPLPPTLVLCTNLTSLSLDLQTRVGFNLAHLTSLTHLSLELVNETMDYLHPAPPCNLTSLKSLVLNEPHHAFVRGSVALHCPNLQTFHMTHDGLPPEGDHVPGMVVLRAGAPPSLKECAGRAVCCYLQRGLISLVAE